MVRHVDPAGTPRGDAPDHRDGSSAARQFAALLPHAAVVEAVSHNVTERLGPAEAAAVAAAVPSRVAEFTTGRACAHEALRRLGVPAASIGRGGRGEPLWPAGVVGSITHCDGLRAAAVARRGEVTGVGIDAEPHLPLPVEVADLTLTPPERRRVAQLGAAVPDIAWDRVVFSLKEATYKLWYPLRREWLGFEEVDSAVHTDGTFTVDLPRPLPTPDGEVRVVRGRWAVTDGLLFTAAALTPGMSFPQR